MELELIEDYNICKIMREKKIGKLPDWRLATEFSIEKYYHTDSFGCHQPGIVYLTFIIGWFINLSINLINNKTVLFLEIWKKGDILMICCNNEMYFQHIFPPVHRKIQSFDVHWYIYENNSTDQTLKLFRRVR